MKDTVMDYVKSLIPFHGRHANDNGLRHCPFCGSEDVYEGSVDGCAGPCRAVSCHECAAHGPIRDTAEAAIAYWNALHGLPKFSGKHGTALPDRRWVRRGDDRVLQQKHEVWFEANPRQRFFEWRDVPEVDE